MTVSSAVTALVRQRPIKTVYLTSSAEKSCDAGDKWKASANGNGNNNNNNNSGQQQPLTPFAAFRRWKRSEQAAAASVASQQQQRPSERLQFLAINALELSAPASDVLLKGRARWFQVSGHADSLAPAGPGTVWKRRVGAEDAERRAYEALSSCAGMRACIPRYYREVEYGGERFIELQDLLHGFDDPHVMDIKMGARTFLEGEVSKTQARADLYAKMVAVDPEAPTPEEHEAKAVTKLRYMQFREEQSSTSGEGFRIEGIKTPGRPPVNDLQRVKSRAQVVATIAKFLGGRRATRRRIVERLKEIREEFERCEYFRTHEIVGSSIFLIFDENSVGAWMIDFAKTQPVPAGVTLDHRTPWKQGNHEEGFLYGLDRLIENIENIDMDNAAATIER